MTTGAIEKFTADELISAQGPIRDNLEKLKEIFPEAFTDDGIDFEVLKQLLGGALDERDERYGLNWHGKRAARQMALAPSSATLLPQPHESKAWESTRNIMIEGDNLEVLKILRRSYARKIKMIYIDPPYNTGKDFVYRDDFRDGIRNYLEITRQISEGVKLRSHTETSGRFHTDWMNMIYPRLKIARDLLTDDGLIFISIDDNEVDRLRLIGDEIFGEENFVAQFVWSTEGHTDNQFDVKITHEYIVLYAVNADAAKLGHVVDPNTRAESNLWKGFAENSITKNGPANPPSEIVLPAGFPCVSDTLDLPRSQVSQDFFSEVSARGFISRDITDKHGVTYPLRLDAMRVVGGLLNAPCRIFSGWANAKKLKTFIAGGCQPIDEDGDTLSFYLSANGVVYYKRERGKARNIVSVLRNMGTTEKMRSEIERQGILFQYPKPKELIKYLVRIGCPGSGIVLDFFAGSGTTAQAVFEQNVEDQADRQVLLVQMPEPTRMAKEGGGWEESLAWKAGFKTIADITKRRFLHAGENLPTKADGQGIDTGFRVFRLASSNIRAWQPASDGVGPALLEAADHLVAGRSEQDVLYELLLKLGFDLCAPVEAKAVAGRTVYSVAGGALLICLAEDVTPELVEPLSAGILGWRDSLAPAVEPRVIFNDAGFTNDVAKTNMAAILNQSGISDVRSL